MGSFPGGRTVLARPRPLSLFIPPCPASAALGARPCGILWGGPAWGGGGGGDLSPVPVAVGMRCPW